MLTLDGVSKSYGKRAVLGHLDHKFTTGLNVLVGPSGAGKSTLLRLCATAENPTSGRLLWNDKPVRSMRRKLRFKLGYAPQIVDLPQDVTGLEFLLHIAALKGLGRAARTQAHDLLEQLGLGPDADHRIIGWSGGMRRRLIFAQALLGAPELLALDEPTAELDSETAKRVAALISNAAQTSTIILTTHLSEHFKSEGASILRVFDGELTPVEVAV